jgi:hypothetical protein
MRGEVVLNVFSIQGKCRLFGMTIVSPTPIGTVYFENGGGGIKLNSAKNMCGGYERDAVLSRAVEGAPRSIFWPFRRGPPNGYCGPDNTHTLDLITPLRNIATPPPPPST